MCTVWSFIRDVSDTGRSKFVTPRFLPKFSATLSCFIDNLATSGRMSKQAVSVFADAGIALVALWLAYTFVQRMFYYFGNW